MIAWYMYLCYLCLEIRGAIAPIIALYGSIVQLMIEQVHRIIRLLYIGTLQGTETKDMCLVAVLPRLQYFTAFTFHPSKMAQ